MQSYTLRNTECSHIYRMRDSILENSDSEKDIGLMLKTSCQCNTVPQVCLHSNREVQFLVQVHIHTLALLVLMLKNSSKNGTSVENFSCVIYNISFMNCTWEAVFIGSKNFQDVKDIKNTVYFLVNGSSSKSEIQFYDDDYFILEKLTPPLNITVSCSEDRAECIVQWKQPQLSHMERNGDGCFEYQIDIRNKKTNVSVTF
uniref:Type I cytokine receptor cytokine-binding domain-containing protein n=1 Tax=Gopherus agassizii TaxID=38772 RepID=A0A452GI81_9SAUR